MEEEPVAAIAPVTDVLAFAATAMVVAARRGNL